MLKLQDKFVVQWLVLVYESSIYVMKKWNQWKIRPNQAKKNADRKNKWLFLQGRKNSSDAIKCEMKAVSTAVNSRTIRRRLSGFGLQSRIQTKYLNQNQREKQVKWTKEYIK